MMDLVVDIDSVMVVEIGHTATLYKKLSEALLVDRIGSLVAFDIADYELTSQEFLVRILAGGSDYPVLVAGLFRKADACPVAVLKARLHA